jgi:hypothetical protein
VPHHHHHCSGSSSSSSSRCQRCRTQALGLGRPGGARCWRRCWGCQLWPRR